MREPIYTKYVNKSLISMGFSIPVASEKAFDKCIGIPPKGERKQFIILLGGKQYKAHLLNVDVKGGAGYRQVRYTDKEGLVSKLKEIFATDPNDLNTVAGKLKAYAKEPGILEFECYPEKADGELERMEYEQEVIKDAKDQERTINENTTVYDLNMILYGPPGTGKTYNTAIYAVAICDGRDIEAVKAMPYNQVMERYRVLKEEEHRIAFTTFHQSYGYEEFIEGIKPVMSSYGNEIGYEIKAGMFKKFCENAQNQDVTALKPYVFIVDEINRGNISKIFGELITLIENTKRSGMDEEASAILPYSGEVFSVPQNVYILGTMNTADRSIALMDTALRRRFQFIEMMPEPEILRKIGADKIVDEDIELDVAQMLETINLRIEYLYDREHTIGHAFFTGLAAEPTIEKLASIFEKSVLPLLQEYFYEDYSKIMLVLGDNGKKKSEHKFILEVETKANHIFRGDVSDIDIPEYTYKIQDSAFYDIMSYKEITG